MKQSRKRRADGLSWGRLGGTGGALVSGVRVLYDARGSRDSARTRKPSRQGRVTVLDQGEQVDEEEEEDVDGHAHGEI